MQSIAFVSVAFLQGSWAGAELELRPLVSPVNSGSAQTRFAKLDPDRTGIAEINRYDDPSMWRERYVEFNNGAIGTGVAMADFDGDGRVDVYVANKTDSGRLYRNDGDMRFTDVTKESGAFDDSGAWKSGVAIADVNNDGDVDLLVCRIGEANLFYLNKGDGTFRESGFASGLAGAFGAASAAFADFDRDGWVDCYLLTNVSDARQRPDGDADQLLRNRGDGTFEDVTESAGIEGEGRGHSATWWDYDEDGWPDLYVANDFAPRDRLYRNNGDGTFSDRLDAVTPAFPFSAMGADVDDVNGDGHLDFFVADMAATTQEKDRRGMADARSRSRENTLGSSEASQVQRNVLLLGGSGGRMREAAWMSGLAATDWTWSVRWVDLDNDGWLDLHVTNGMNREQHNTDLLRKMFSASRPEQRVRALANSPVFAEANLAFRRVGALEFSEMGSLWNLDETGVSFGAAWGDLDGDGDLDTVYSNFDQPPTVLRNDSNEGHRLLVRLKGTRSNRLGLGAIVDATLPDGRQLRRTLLSARGYASSSDPRLHFGLGEADRIERLRVTWPSGLEQEFFDIPANHELTVTESGERLVVPEKRTQKWKDVSKREGLALTVPTSAPDPTVPQPLLSTGLHYRGPHLVVADLWGSETPEVTLSGSSETGLGLLERTSNGWRTEELNTGRAAGMVDGPIAAIDLDGDGDRDLLIARGGANWPEGSVHYQPVWLQRDGESWSLRADATLPKWNVSAGAAAVADFDGNGREEVFLGGGVLPGRYPLSPEHGWWEPGAGAVTDRSNELPERLKKAGMIRAAVAADVFGGPRPELLLAVDWGPVSCWSWFDGKGWRDVSDQVGLDRRIGWWRSLAVGDLNGDGHLDVVAGNDGLNTPYSGAVGGEGGSRLLAKEQSDGRLALIEARWEHGAWYPRVSLRQAAQEWPELGRRFGSSDAFAQATLDQVWPPGDRTGWWDRTATELRSGVWLSDGTDTRRFAPLPREVQIAPAQSLVIRDFDGDGVLDMFVAQNSQMPSASVGRFDGGIGQLLRGVGQGADWRVEPVAPQDSGLIVPGQASSACWWSNGSGDETTGLLLISRVNEPLMAFERSNGLVVSESQ